MGLADGVSKGLLLVGALLLGFCGYYVARPNFYGHRFKEKHCNITSSYSDFNFQTCSCGDECTSVYPCIVVTGFYWDKVTNGNVTYGTFHKNYKAAKDECVYVPKCSSKTTKNSDRVLGYFAETIFPLVDSHDYPMSGGKIVYSSSSVFECFAFEGEVFFHHTYSNVKAYCAIFIPLGVFLVGYFVGLIGGDSSYQALLCLPLFPIFMLFTACQRRNCCQCLRRRRRHPQPSVDSSFRPHRRSLSLSISSGESSVPEPTNPPNYMGDLSKEGPPAYSAEGVYELPAMMEAPVYHPDNTDTANLPPPPSYNDVVQQPR